MKSNTGVIVPAFLGAGIVVSRAVLGNKRAPYPYELLPWAVVFGGIGIVTGGSEEAIEFGEIVAWGYLVAMILAPSFANVLNLIPASKNTPTKTNPTYTPNTTTNPSSGGNQ